MSKRDVGGPAAGTVSVKKNFWAKSSKVTASDFGVSPGKKGLRFLLILLVVATILAGVYWFFLKDGLLKRSTSGQDLTKITKVSQASDTVTQFSGDYTQTSKDLLQASYANWDKETLDKAYFNLQYADKIGAYTQVYNTLFMIETAGRNGVKIDENSYGIGQQGRDEIRKRADAAAQRVRETGATNE